MILKAQDEGICLITYTEILCSMAAWSAHWGPPLPVSDFKHTSDSDFQMKFECIIAPLSKKSYTRLLCSMATLRARLWKLSKQQVYYISSIFTYHLFHQIFSSVFIKLKKKKYKKKSESELKEYPSKLLTLLWFPHQFYDEKLVLFIRKGTWLRFDIRRVVSGERLTEFSFFVSLCMCFSFSPFFLLSLFVFVCICSFFLHSQP